MYLDQYLGKNILAWLSYNMFFQDNYSTPNRICYVRPQYMMKGTTYTAIDENDFPNHGQMEVRLQGNSNADEVLRTLGSLVIITINTDPYFNEDNNNVYNIKYNAEYGKRSDLFMESFSGTGFYQVVDVSSTIETIYKNRSISKPGCSVYTSAILLRYNNKLYGPFDADLKNNSIDLNGMKQFAYYVGEYNASELESDLLDIKSQTNEVALTLLPRSAVISPDKCAKSFDFISDTTLINSFMETLRVQNKYTKDQISQLKNIAQEVHATSTTNFTPERREKIKSLLTHIKLNAACSQEVIQYLLDNEFTKPLIVQEITSNHLEEIKGQLLEFASIKNDLAELQRQKSELKDQVDKLQKQEQDAQDKLQSTLQQEQAAQEALKSKGSILGTSRVSGTDGTSSFDFDLDDDDLTDEDFDFQSDASAKSSPASSSKTSGIDVDAAAKSLSILSKAFILDDNQTSNRHGFRSEPKSKQKARQHQSQQGENKENATSDSKDTKEGENAEVDNSEKGDKSDNSQINGHFALGVATKIPVMDARTQAKVDKLKANYEKKSKALENTRAELEAAQNEINQLKELIANKDQQLQEAHNKLEISATCDELNEKVAALNKKYQETNAHYVRMYAQKQQEMADLEQQFKEVVTSLGSQAKQTVRLLDNKLVTQLIHSLDEEPEQRPPVFDSSCLHQHLEANEIIDRVYDYLVQAHRNTNRNDVANYLICLTQGFITTFAGEPGTGKTSLCSLLAKALGLATNDTNNRFVEVAVERGWSSCKDLIGYYNPLTKTVVKSNLEAFNAFATLNQECGSAEHPYAAAKYAPYLMVLDEANLSPIEHYWAAFLKNCDMNSSSHREITLGGNCSFNLPEHLRFLATVNFDHTTEELSPRFLDRSWIIVLDPTQIDPEIMAEPACNAPDMISFEDLKQAFSVQPDDSLDEVLSNKLDAIQAIFRDESIAMPIMPRSLKMVRSYCIVASKCMERGTSATRLAPLDYAFAQKILPSLNGTGDSYKKLVKELLEECSELNMPLSAKHLKRMERTAERNMGFYQFFAR